MIDTRATLAFLTIFALTSCYYRSENRTEFGKFVLIERLKTNQMDWEGANTSGDGNSLCSLVEPHFCIYSERPMAVLHSPRPAMRYLSTIAGDRMWHLNAITGKPLPCTTCGAIDASIAQEGSSIVVGDWSKDGSVRTSLMRRPGGLLDVVVFRYSDESVDAKVVKTLDRQHSSQRISSFGSSANNAKLAWLECGDRCDLVVMDRASNELSSSPTGCTERHTLALRWRGQEPEIVHTKEAGTHDEYLCADENGVARYRVEKLSHWDPAYKEWAERASRGEFDNEPLPRLRNPERNKKN